MVKKNIFKNLDDALVKVEKHRKTSAEKAAETKAHSKRMAEMQSHLDASPEKRKLFMDCIKNASDENGIKILKKGIVVFVFLLEILEILEEDLKKESIEFKSISSKTSANKRSQIEDWFCENPENKIVVITTAGGQSLNLHATNEIVLYNIPNGYRPFKQTIGRIARGFGKYDSYNIHIISIEDSIDEYKQILISSKKQLENELLTADTIPLKGVKSFDGEILKRIRKKLLWKNKQ